jgi:hypothetical protein
MYNGEESDGGESYGTDNYIDKNNDGIEEHLIDRPYDPAV